MNTAPTRTRSAFATIVLSSRPLSWINTAFPFAAAYLMTTREVDWVLIVGTVFFLVPYNLAMYGINDVFDYESDLANARKGGVEGALLPPDLHGPTLWAATLSCLPFLVFLLVVGGPASWAVLGVSMFAVVAYSAKGLRFKERPVLDSVTSSTHFVSPALYGLVLADAGFTPALWLILAAFFLWGMASHAFGAVQDVAADRQANIGSIATAFGARATVRLAVLSYAAAGILLLGASAVEGRWWVAIGAALAVPYVVVCAPFWNVTDAASHTANRGWRRFLLLNFISGFVVTMLLIAFWTAAA